MGHLLFGVANHKLFMNVTFTLQAYQLNQVEEFLQRYLIRLRVEFHGLNKVTCATNKSKVGQEFMTLPSVYTLKKHVGAVLPMQVLLHVVDSQYTVRSFKHTML